MARSRVKVHTTRSRNGNIGQIARNLDDRMDMVVYRYAIRVQKNARIRAPVDTGYLKSSIKAKKIAKGTWHIDVKAPYGIYVEFGTRHMAAQPYFKPATELAKKQMRVDFKAVFKNGNQLRIT